MKKLSKTEYRSALIAAAVAVLVAAPLSNAAHEGVGQAAKVLRGKQGKTGKRGPKGERGPTGATGPAGPRGEAGKTTVVATYGASVKLAPGEQKTAIRACPLNLVPSGIGADISGGGTLVRSGSGVISLGEGDYYTYFAVILNDGDNFVEASVTATCS